jgi:hypothetical protein
MEIIVCVMFTQQQFLKNPFPEELHRPAFTEQRRILSGIELRKSQVPPMHTRRLTFRLSCTS